MKALEITNLRKIYDNRVEALKGINLSVQQGDFFALLGPNGAGKSTAIGIITSLVTKTSGEIKIFDLNFDQQLSQIKALIGLVPQEFNFNIFHTPLNILITQAGYYGISRRSAHKQAELFLKKLDLWHKRHQPARFLSGGQKRRLMIARALVHNPQLLILDEPTAGVDIEIRRSMWQFLREINKDGTTIILTTHYLEEAENLCKNIAIINHGKIIEHTSMQELLTKLHVETFIFYCAKPLEKKPILTNFTVRIPEPSILEIDVQQGQMINTIFTELSQQNIQVVSMRNKVNRLEELFVHLTMETVNED